MTLENNPKFCGQCGASVTSEDRFCSTCGINLSPDAIVRAYTPWDHKTKRKPPSISVYIILGIISCFFIFYFITQISESTRKFFDIPKFNFSSLQSEPYLEDDSACQTPYILLNFENNGIKLMSEIPCNTKSTQVTWTVSQNPEHYSKNNYFIRGTFLNNFSNDFTGSIKWKVYDSKGYRVDDVVLYLGPIGPGEKYPINIYLFEDEPRQVILYMIKKNDW